MTIGIMGAMREEISPLLAHYGEYESIMLGGNTFYKVRYGGSQIIIAYSRIGKVHASITATTMILRFACEGIIFTGVAGSIDEGLRVGDLLLANKLCQHDVDISAFGHKLGFVPEGKMFYSTDEKLNAAAKSTAAKTDVQLKEGTIASGDVFVADKAKKSFIRNEFGASAVEMEGASVACVCDNFGVPCCILRSISDDAGGDANVSFDKFLEESARSSARFVVSMVEELR